HVLCLDKISTGDGIVAALQVVSILVESGKNLNELCSGMQTYPQILENVKITKKINLDNNLKLKQAVKDAEQEMAGKGRVLLRASGTEPLIRVMVEGETEQMIQPHVAKLVDLVKQEFCS
ncbi:MAG TPA: phosphoglucosamine mutase, partial [Thiomicrospira sp.]|nr:phosphoglucosamine mutase [Thiomicrospira sp.]